MLGAGDTAVPNKVGSFPHGAISSWEKETHSEGIKELVKVKVSQWRPTLCNPMNCSPLGSSVHHILQARILESVAISFSKVSSWPRDQTQVSCIAGRLLSKPAGNSLPQTPQQQKENCLGPANRNLTWTITMRNHHLSSSSQIWASYGGRVLKLRGNRVPLSKNASLLP